MVETAEWYEDGFISSTCLHLFLAYNLWQLVVQVSEKQAKDWCASRGYIPYFETSAKEGYSVDEAFLCVARTAITNEQGCDLDK